MPALERGASSPRGSYFWPFIAGLTTISAMLAFWPDVVRPLLTALQPRSIIEIGSESGRTTRLLLDFARMVGETRVHAVDPAPLFDVDAWQQDFGDQFVFHRAPSLTTIGGLDHIDVVLIDGDHNWYTVFNELKAIERRCRQLGEPLPLVLLHDVSWPYGRRDIYYDPATIPAEHRQPYARRGISPTESLLLPEGGINAQLCNAVHEGGPKNGVLTAVEDYLAETAERFVFAKIPAVYGLGILLPEGLAKSLPRLAQLVSAWTVPEVERFIDRLENARIAMLTGCTG